jgi:hypothetical protein
MEPSTKLHKHRGGRKQYCCEWRSTEKSQRKGEPQLAFEEDWGKRFR